ALINSLGNLSLLRGTDNQFNGADLPGAPEKMKSYAVSELVICRLLSADGFEDLSGHPPHKKALGEIGWPTGLSLNSWDEDSVLTLQEFYARSFAETLAADLGIS
ncbi:MAG: hypothetical protein WBH26_07940, partial [Pontimonas sp.]